ncbi:MAG: RIO1 family regulatory kinase/ATPase [Omnitrophica WOR_2 bacterium]
MRNRENDEASWWLQLNDEYVPVKNRQRKNFQRKKIKPVEARAELAEQLYQEEAEYNFTYHASRHEQQWISLALRTFYEDSLISDVLSMVKAGKEANVYCCRAHPNIGLGLLAAKIYRPSLLRNLKNDAIYKEGRPLFSDEGKAIRGGREHRAVAKKTRKGKEITITSWIEHEYLTMQVLHKAGADVPRPVAQSGNAILMEFIGEEGSPAPVLSDVRLPYDEARPMFKRLVEDVGIFLAHDRIHADLSAYNILYWEGKGTLIDFPQVVDPIFNPNGARMLLRDVTRLCQYFYGYGIKADPQKLTNDLWGAYLRGDFRTAY